MCTLCSSKNTLTIEINDGTNPVYVLIALTWILFIYEPVFYHNTIHDN